MASGPLSARLVGRPAAAREDTSPVTAWPSRPVTCPELRRWIESFLGFPQPAPKANMSWSKVAGQSTAIRKKVEVPSVKPTDAGPAKKALDQLLDGKIPEPSLRIFSDSAKNEILGSLAMVLEDGGTPPALRELSEMGMIYMLENFYSAKTGALMMRRLYRAEMLGALEVMVLRWRLGKTCLKSIAAPEA